MGNLTDMLPAGFEGFAQDAEFLWACIVRTNRKREIDQEQFIKALDRSITFLNGLSMEEVKAVCLKGDMAEKVSMIIDLKDYVYDSLIDEWNAIFTDL